MPEAQTLFTVSEGTSFGMPRLDLRLARRDLALAGLKHLPEDDLLDLLGVDARSARAPRSRASPPSSTAFFGARAPPIFPKGVRAVPRITVSGMRLLLVDEGPRDGPGARGWAMLEHRSCRSTSSRAPPRPISTSSASPTASPSRPAGRAAGRRRRQDRLQEDPAAAPQRVGARAGRRPRKARGPRRRAAPSRGRCRSQAGRVAGGDLALLGSAREPSSVELPIAGAAIVEGTILAGYRFDRYKAREEDDPPPPSIERLLLLAPDVGRRRRDRRRGPLRPRRRPGREPRPRAPGPAGERPQPDLPRRAGPRDRRAFEPVSVEVLDRARISELGMGGLEAVSKGSAEEPA